MAQKEKEKYNNRVTDGRNFILDARLPLSADGPPISRSTNSFSHFQFKAFFHKIPVEVYLYNHLVVEFLHYE